MDDLVEGRLSFHRFLGAHTPLRVKPLLLHLALLIHLLTRQQACFRLEDRRLKNLLTHVHTCTALARILLLVLALTLWLLCTPAIARTTKEKRRKKAKKPSDPSRSIIIIIIIIIIIVHLRMLWRGYLHFLSSRPVSHLRLPGFFSCGVARSSSFVA